MSFPRKLSGHEFEPQTVEYDERDVSLYALGIGAARMRLTRKSSSTSTNSAAKATRAFPTFAVTLPFGTLGKLMTLEGPEVQSHDVAAWRAVS